MLLWLETLESELEAGAYKMSYLFRHAFISQLTRKRFRNLLMHSTVVTYYLLLL